MKAYCYPLSNKDYSDLVMNSRDINKLDVSLASGRQDEFTLLISPDNISSPVSVCFRHASPQHLALV